MSKEAIIERILSDADAQARAAIEEAENKAAEILAVAEKQCDSYRRKVAADIARAVEDVAARVEVVAGLDAGKLMLAAKADILDRVYAMALEKARALDKKTYRKVVEGMLQCAENGDKVIVSERERGIVTKDMVAEVAKSKNIKLTLSSEKGTFDGGIILTSDGVDKNLTLETEFALLRTETEAETAKKLFG